MQGAILWSEWHEHHITERHKVSATEVAEIIDSPRTRVTDVIEEDNHPGRRYVLFDPNER